MQSKLTSSFGKLKLTKLHRTRADTEARIPPRLERELWFIDNWRGEPPWRKREVAQRPKWMDGTYFKKELVPRELAYSEFVFPEDNDASMFGTALDRAKRFDNLELPAFYRPAGVRRDSWGGVHTLTP